VIRGRTDADAAEMLSSRPLTNVLKAQESSSSFEIRTALAAAEDAREFTDAGVD
jgi:hypothetical protein